MTAQMCDGHAVQNISLRNFKFNHFYLTMCKGIDLQCRWQIQNAGSLTGSLQFRIDNHSKTQAVTQVADFLAVIRRAHAGNGGAVTHTLGNGAAQEIQLIRSRDGDE